MRAVLFAGEGAVRVDEVPAPRLRDPDDAVVRVSLSAICGSDLHLLDGKTPGMREGSVIGHEFVGVVEDCDSGVTSVTPGDRVLGSFLIVCGTCPACAAKRFNFCHNRRALGLGVLTGDLDGAQAESVLVPKADVNLKPLDDGLSDERALFGGDILATGFFAASLAEPEPDEHVAVVGAGPIGLLTGAALKHMGAEPLLLDIEAARVSSARELGYRAAQLGQRDVLGVVAEHTEGAMAAAAIDAVGSVPAFKTAMMSVRDGGRVVVIGVYGAERYEFPMGKVWIRGLDLRFGGMANVQAHWDEALAAVASGSLDPTRLISHRLPLEEAEKGYELFAAREATKVVLIP